MDCQEATKLIDERVDLAREPSPADAGERDWSGLDAHLSQCARCRGACAELMQAREVLCEVAGDEPSNQEIEAMWAAIQTGLSATPAIKPMASRRKTIRTFVVATLGAAAVLLLAFQLGRLHYGSAAGFPASLRSWGGADTPLASQLAPASEGADLVASAGEARGFVTLRGVGQGAHLWDDKNAEWFPHSSYPPSAAGEQRGVTADAAGKVVLRTPMMAGSGRGFAGGYVAGPRDDVDGRHWYDNTTGPVTEGFLDQSRGRAIFVGEEYKPLASPGLAKLPDAEGTKERYTGQKVTDAGRTRSERIAGAEVVGPPAPSAWKIDALAEQWSEDGGNVSFGFADVSGDLIGGPVGGVPQATEAPPALRPETKVIKAGELGLEVEEYAAAVKRVYALAEEYGGFVADGSSQEQAGGALLGHVVIRMPPERFEALFAVLKQIGRVEAENVKAADVTAEYVDIEARIASLQIAEQRLRELMQSKSFMDKISALLEVERELTRVRSEIEQLQGQLRVMADRVALSTITVTLREPTRTVPSASLSVEVPVLSDAEDALGAALAGLNGRLTSGQTSKRDDGTLMGNYKLSVSLASFAQLLVAIDGIGRVEARQIKDRQFADATAPWADKVMCQVALVLYERSRQLPQGVVTLEVKSVADALAGLDPVLVATDGAVISNQTARRDDGSSVAELDLRVPAGRFADLVAGLEPLGRTTAKQVAGEAGQIVGGAANVPCQVKLTLAEPAREVPSGGMILEVGKFETARQQLSAMIAANSVQVLGSTSQQRTDGTSYGTFRLGIKAADMEAVVSKLESLGRIESRQITGLGLGDLSQADPDALGVVELTLAEKAAISPEPRRAGDSLRERLREGLAGLYASLGLIVYGVILLAPWAVIVLLVAWLITRPAAQAAVGDRHACLKCLIAGKPERQSLSPLARGRGEG